MPDNPQPSTQSTSRLPYEDMFSLITAGDLARLLGHKGIISAQEFEWLVIKAFIRPRAEAMNEDNWSQMRSEMLEFLNREKPKPPS